MKFNEYLDNAWTIHPTESQKLLNEFKDHFTLVENNEHIVSMAHLITHVAGEHLGQWSKGRDLLEELEKNSQLTDTQSLLRFKASLNLCENENYSLNNFSSSDQIRILALAASALASQNDLKRSADFLNQAMNLAEAHIAKDDPANRSLAVAGNNLAASLEEKPTLSNTEKELMIKAATIGRKFWEIAGTWMHVERAEYRLAKTYLKAEKPDRALTHASNCLEVIAQNGHDPLEEFFGQEALSLIEKKRSNQIGYEKAKTKMKEAFEKLSEENKSWCKAYLENV